MLKDVKLKCAIENLVTDQLEGMGRRIGSSARSWATSRKIGDREDLTF